MKPAWLEDADHRHGMQMALAVLLAYATSIALRLPEGFWAVMSALIVMRPSAGATMGAGWDRVRGTAVGTAAGLFGVWLRHRGLSLPFATLAIVAALAFASGLVPALRSAPITALIVVSSGDVGGHSAFAVAGLRVLEIAIGIAAGLAVNSFAPSARAATRFDASCSALLRLLARQCRSQLRPDRIAPNEAAGMALRVLLRRLTLLATDVEREARLPWRRWARGAGPTPDVRHRQRALVSGRVAQQVGAFGRLHTALPSTHDDPLWAELREAIGDALDSSGDAVDGTGTARLAPLRLAGESIRTRLRDSQGTDPVAALVAGPLRLLADDLILLGRLPT